MSYTGALASVRSLEQRIRNLEGSDGLALRAQLTRHAAIQRQTRLPVGYGRLDDAALANATIWAPTDAAFAKPGDEPKSLSPDELEAMLGFHITPPTRTPEGDYPFITFEYLAHGGRTIHQTRTGIL